MKHSVYGMYVSFIFQRYVHT